MNKETEKVGIIREQGEYMDPIILDDKDLELIKDKEKEDNKEE